MSRTLIIAEPGGTHEGRLDKMVELLQVAADCGANVFKSQWTSNPQAMCDRRHAPEYLADYEKLHYPLEWHRGLSGYAKQLGLQYACSVYLPGDALLVAPVVDFLKISSFEAADDELHAEALQTGRVVIVSAGMEDEGARLFSARRLCWRLRGVSPTRWLHCVSSYPAPLSALNLCLLGNDGEDREYYHGFSDHSRDVRVGAWAVCAGAEILEAHFRLDDCDPANKDYAVAFSPAEFKEYIQNVRDAETALGDGVKRLQPCEAEMAKYRVTA